MNDVAFTSAALKDLFTDTTSPKELGAKVRSKRVAKGLSRASLATLANVSDETIRLLEHGKGNATLNTIAGIAKALYMTS